MGVVGGDPDGLRQGGHGLAEVGDGLGRRATDLRGSATSCASAVDGPLAQELTRYAEALACFVDELGLQVRATGLLASSVGRDLAQAGGQG